MRSRGSLVRTGLPVLVGAIACLGFARSGFLAPLFLLPIALIAYRFKSSNAWLVACLAALLNMALSSLYLRDAGSSVYAFLADGLYFSVVAISFAWAVVPEGFRGGERRMRMAYRIVSAAVISTLATIPVIMLARRDEGLVALIRHQAEGFVAAYTEAAGADVVQRSLIEQNLKPESIIAAISEVYVKGAAVVAHTVFLFVSWRVSLFFASFRDPALRKRGSFALFHLEAYMIWPLIAAFATVLAALVLKIVPLEIVGWNLLALVLLLYMAQGYGVIQYQLARPGIPRSIGPLVTLVVALALIRPGINAILAGAIAALGIAENWLPLRAPIKTEPPSTPEA